VRASARAWAGRTANSRCVEHYFEQGRGRHVTFCEPGLEGDGKPADGGWEFETCPEYGRLAL
jgi:hypothetical protein